MKRSLVAAAATLAVTLAAQPAVAANLTPDQLTQATSAGATDLLLLYPTGGPMRSIQWSVVTSLMQSALGGTFLQVGNNLADVNSPSSARNNLGLGTAATQNTGTSGATLPFLNGANTWSGAQTFNGKLTLFASASSGAPLNIPQGAAPSAPASGDCWTTSADLFCALGGATQAYLTTTSAASTYAPLASPALTGTPTAPTAANGTNTTQIATTAFVLANAGGAPCTSTNGALQFDNLGAFGCAPMTASSSNVSMSAATFTPSTTKGIVGTAAADNAQTGSVGEFVSSNVARASAVALTSNTAANVTSVSLTAGDWDCRGNVAFIAGSSPSQEIAAIGTTSATLPALPDSGGETRLTLAIGTADDTAISAGTIRENVSSTTTVFLIGDATFTGSSSAYGFVGCRRVR